MISLNTVFAAGNPSLYIEYAVAKSTVKLPDGEFKFSSNALKLGYYFNPKVSVEAHYYQGLGDDNRNGHIVEIDNMTSVFLRIGSTTRKNFRSYLLLGQSNISLNSNRQGTISLEDFTYAFGAEERLRRWPLLFLNAEYIRHYDDNGSTITSTSIGLRYEF